VRISRPTLTALLIIVLFSGAPVIAQELKSYAFVNEDGTLRIKQKTIHLYGIHIPKTNNNCRTTQQPPVCGQRAALALEFKINSFVKCEIVSENPNGSLTGLCVVNYSHFDEGEDLSAYLLERGWAAALPDAPVEYHTLEKIAQSRGMGVWGIAIDRPYLSPFR
jgi:endonuclease YncB( thermonuclease family)